MLIAVKFLLQLLSEAAAKPPFLAEETFLSEVFASPAFHIFQLDQNELERSASFILTFRASHLVDHFFASPSVGPVLSHYATCADLTDVTLADEDTNSTLTDNANRAFQGNVAT